MRETYFLCWKAHGDQRYKESLGATPDVAQSVFEQGVSPTAPNRITPSPISPANSSVLGPLAAT